MKKEELLLKSFIDENPISVLVYTPEGDPKGIIQIVHGMIEHKGRYENFMNFVCNQGYIVIAADTRGHGKSVKSAEDFGYFGEDGANSVVEDTHQVTLYIKDKYPDLKICLFGHSLGSLIVRKYLKKYDKDIDKLIVCGSPSYNPLLKTGLSYIKILKKFKGDHFRSKLITNYSFNGFNKGLSGKGKNRWLSSNEESINELETDPLCNFIFTLNGYETMFNLLKEVYDTNGWEVNKPDLPILFISGSEDRALINYDKWIEAQQYLKDVGYTDVSNKLYDNYRHEILKEKNNDGVYLDIIEFISK